MLVSRFVQCADGGWGRRENRGHRESGGAEGGREAGGEGDHEGEAGWGKHGEAGAAAPGARRGRQLKPTPRP